MRIAIGVLVWSIILIGAYKNAPRLLPHSAKLARFGIGCAALMIPAGLVMLISGEHEWHRTQGTLMTITGVTAGVGMFTGIVCGAVAFILDGWRSPR